MSRSSDGSERHRRVRDMLLSVQRLPAAERAAYLDEACADDADLRAEVETLLVHLGGPLGADVASDDSPRDGAGSEPMDKDLPGRAAPLGERVGPYRIVRPLGTGGMGEVFEARQESPVRRTVALKVIKRGMDTQQVVARFEAERQALALMSHPNIARVFDVGSTEQGRPYFAMEFVAGEPITAYCDARRLSLRARLELFQRVCAGIQHAHHNGVIHRDIKPGNILVEDTDGVATPKIIDFGIAKATREPLSEGTLTTLGQLVGTPTYMSPEQIEPTNLDVDTRADVYAAGAVLYELLVGAPPFDIEALMGAGFDELRGAILETDPPRPSTRLGSADDAEDVAAARATDPENLVRRLRGDLDWIVMKALEKDRARRYATPAELAADVGRHLADEPVLAGPPSRRYRAGKFVRRHRAGVVAATVVLLAVLVGAGLAAAGFFRAVEAERVAVREAEIARRVSDFLLGMFRGFDPRSFHERTPDALDVLARTAERIDEELIDEPEIRAQLQAALGGIYSQMGLYAEARPLLESALATRRVIFAAGDRAVTMSMSDLAWLDYNTGDYAAALAGLEQALEMRRDAVGADHVHVAALLIQVGAVLWRLGRLDEAMSRLEQARSIQERDLGPDHIDVANTRYEQALVQMDLGDWRAARANLEHVLAARQAITGPDNLGVADVAFELGDLLIRMNEVEAGEAHLLHALRVRESALGPEHPDVAFLLQAVGSLRLDQGDYEQAGELYERAGAILEAKLGRDHVSVAGNRSRRAGFHARIGDFERARALYQEALEITENALGPNHPDVAGLLTSLGRGYRRTGDPAAARTLLERAMELHEAIDGASSPAASTTLHGLANALRDLGAYDEALVAYDRALAIRERVMGSGHVDVARILESRATLHLRTGELDEARALLERALDAQTAGLPPNHLDIARTLERLGTVHERAGEADRARALQARAREIRDRHRRAVDGLAR